MELASAMETLKSATKVRHHAKSPRVKNFGSCHASRNAPCDSQYVAAALGRATTAKSGTGRSQSGDFGNSAGRLTVMPPPPSLAAPLASFINDLIGRTVRLFGPFVDQPVEQSNELICCLLPGPHLSTFVTRRCQLCESDPISDERPDGIRPGGRRTRLNNVGGGIARDFPEHRYVAQEHRPPHGHRLKGRKPEALVETRVHDQVSTRHEFAQDLATHPAHSAYVFERGVVPLGTGPGQHYAPTGDKTRRLHKCLEVLVRQ